MSVGALAIAPVEERQRRALPAGLRWEGRIGTYIHPQNSAVGNKLYVEVDGKLAQVDIDFGVRSLRVDQFRPAVRLVGVDEDVLQTESGMRDVVMQFCDNMMYWSGGAAGFCRRYTVRSTGMDLLFFTILCTGDSIVNAMVEDTFARDEELNRAFLGDTSKIVKVLSRWGKATRNVMRFYHLRGELQALLGVLPGPLAAAMMDLVESPFELVGGEVDNGWARFDILVKRCDWLRMYDVKCWFHTMHRTGDRDYDCGLEFGVFHSRVLEAYGIEIGSDGNGSLLYIAQPPQDGGDFIEYEFDVGSTGVTYNMMNDAVDEDDSDLALQHVGGVIARMNAHGFVDF